MSPEQNLEMTSILEARNIVKDFAGFQVLKDVNLKIPRKGTYALIGPNGAGKTTLFNILSRTLNASSGNLLFNNTIINKTPAHKLSQMGLSRSFQLNSVFDDFNVSENILSAIFARENLSNVFWRDKSHYLYEAELNQVINVFQLESSRKKKASDLSYGFKKKLEIAMASVSSPKLLLLDEPLAGIGLHELQDIKNIILKLAKTSAILLIDHNMNFVRDICEKIFVLHHGQIIASGSFEELMNTPDVVEAYLGSES